ncbi:craniofacial development protein 2-like [Temnothorax curvispinosus]|uniref:Craniofacial development protein 2-like n=1 Tax=Temnothorax curvispinosus TaxID=300111 RepID=A0A6J1QLP4_9HYME|nr:craniofacial development protein 2-like [Temnothorax curvispinosus]
MQRCGVEGLGLSETDLRDSRHFETKNGNMIFLAGNGEKSSNGVGFIVAKTVKNCVLGYEAIGDRIIRIRIGVRPHNLNIIQVYAPTVECTKEEISKFYAKLETTCRMGQRKETTVLLGDFNAKVGKTTHDTHLSQTVGKYGLGARNERGKLLLQFCISNQFTIMNTWFKIHLRRLYTWTSPGGTYQNKIDYVLINTRWRSSITNTKTLPGADYRSDHQLLVAEFKGQLKVIHKASNNRALHMHADVMPQFKRDMGTRLLGMETDLSESVNDMWVRLKTVVVDSAEAIVKQRRGPHSRPNWMSQETWSAVLHRRTLKG